MRWWAILAPAALLSGCDVREMFSTRAEVAAEAAGQQLSVDRLAKVIAAVKGMPMTLQAAEVVANAWVDHTLFAQAVAAGNRLGDSATAAAVLWPQLTETRATRWHDTLLVRHAPLSPDAGDSIYAADGVRVLQHILFRVQPNTKPEERAAARRKAEGAGRQVASGGDFRKLASELSEDPASRTDGGFLPPAPRGQWVTAFDSAGWLLKPGGVTGVIETPFGYHIIRRPPAAEVREKLLQYARERVGATLDSAYMRELGQRKHLEVDPRAPARMRQALADRDQAREDGARLVKFDGGELTVADFVQWVTAMGPNFGGNFGDQPDNAVTKFAQTLAENVLLLKEADSAGIQVSPAEWDGFLANYRNELDSLRAGLGLAGSEIADPAVPAAERGRLAAQQLEAYWDRIAAGSRRPHPIPPMLAVELRRNGEYKLFGAGLRRAVEVAIALKAKADSARTPGPPTGGGTPTPAPGGN